MKTLLTTALLTTALLSPSAFAGWDHSKNENPLTDEVQLLSDSSYVDLGGYQNLATIGIRCDVDSQDLMFTVYTDDGISVPNDDNVNFAMRVDKNKAFQLSGRTFSNAYRSGFARLKGEQARNLVDQFRAGNRVFVQVNAQRQVKSQFTISLAGFTKHSRRALKACGID